MITIPNVLLKHNGLLADNSTKITAYLPELTDEQHLEIIQMARKKTIALIFIDPDKLNDISQILQQASELTEETSSDLTDWTEDEETH